jgi:hypothetical protein
MKKKNPQNNPIYYKSKEDLDKPLYDLMEQLRNDISTVRGKLHDIKFTYGFEDRIEHLEGGLTCMLVAMYEIAKEFKDFEEKHNV